MSGVSDVAFLDALRPVPDMSVLEFAVLMAYYRNPGIDLESVAALVGDWFVRALVPSDLTPAIRRLTQRSWLDADALSYAPTQTGLEASRPLLGGMIRMIDGGRRLWDVGKMIQLATLRERPDEHGN